MFALLNKLIEEISSVNDGSFEITDIITNEVINKKYENNK